MIRTSISSGDLVELRKCRARDIQQAFDISAVQLQRWRDDGCPRHDDKSYSITDVYKWREAKLKGKTKEQGSLKDEKTQQEIELLKARIEKERQQNISRTLHEQILTSRAATLNSYLEKTFLSNAVFLAGKTVDEVRTVVYKLVQAAMEAYTGKIDNEI